MKKFVLLILTVSIVIGAFGGCAATIDSGELEEIRIGMQYGMQYAPVYVMQELELLQEKLPNIKLTFVNLGGGAAMNEALLAGQLDVAFMGIPPALIAWDKGADSQVFVGTCVPPSELMVSAGSEFKSLADFTENTKIAVPSIGSIQHIMLAVAADRQLGDAHFLDDKIVPMANPDAFATLLNESGVSAHMASMPYIDKETDEGFVSILSAKEAFGNASIIGVASKVFAENSDGKYVEIIVEALAESVELINENNQDAVKVISEIEQIDIDTAKEYIKWPGTVFTTDIYGIDELAGAMYEFSYITKEPTEVGTIIWEGAVLRK